jgi:carbamoyl-phosphate synthase large subunit
VLLDRFLSNAIEVDIDAVCDGEQVVIGGIMEHIEQAGVHSGDSACSLPPYSLPQMTCRTRCASRCGDGAGARRLRADERAVGDGRTADLHPRGQSARLAHRALRVQVHRHPLAKVAARCMAGTQPGGAGLGTEEVAARLLLVKEAVLPFIKFPGVDTVLGPEMKSTGEVMGVGDSFAEAFGKAQLAAGDPPPRSGTLLISVRDVDKPAAVERVAARMAASALTLPPPAVPPTRWRLRASPCAGSRRYSKVVRISST